MLIVDQKIAFLGFIHIYGLHVYLKPANLVIKTICRTRRHSEWVMKLSKKAGKAEDC